MRGALSPETLARALRGIAASRKEGILHLTRDDVSKRIYFRDGAIIFAGSDEEHDRLGEVLVRAGRIGRPDLELALRVLKETGESLGKTVVDMGLASPAEIELHAERRTKSIIASIFSWSEGTFYFEERPGGVRVEMSRELPVHEAILESARTISDPEVVRRGVGDLKAVLRQPSNPLIPYDEGSLSSSVEWLLYQANGVSTIEEIVAGSPLDRDKTLQAIFGLVLAGILEIESQERALAARMEGTSVSGERPEIPVRPPGGALDARHGKGEAAPEMLGRYELERLLGRGAMGAVYLARDPAIDRKVAIKLIQTAVHLMPSDLEKYRERFYREAKAAGKLLHPGIVTVFDVGHTTDATPFLVMEYVEGKTLGEILRTRKLDLEEVLRISAEILDALSYAHSRGVVHRDIKPANVLITEDGRAKIMDFGIAHVVGSELTQAEDVLGSPNYMAPEQLSKGVIDPRADLFSFGVVLYRMLTGVLPFRGDSFASIAQAVLFEEPPAPDAVDPSIPAGVSDAVVRCIRKEAAHRFASASDLKQALESPHRPGSRAPSENTPTPPTRPTERRSRLVWALGATAGAVAVIAAMVFLSWVSREPKSAADGEASTRTSPPAGAATQPVEEWPPAASAPDLGSTSDAALYHEASIAFERGDLEASKRTLETLLRRNPAFEGAPELLVRVNERLRAKNAPPSAEDPQTIAPPTRETALTPGEGQLFYEARLAFDKGDLEASKRLLEALVRSNPSFEGASELLVKVNDAIWVKGLPRSYQARHNHRIGGCTGTLSLAAWGIRFSSSEHEWSWRFSGIRVMERITPLVLNLETSESEVLNLGKSKNYRLEVTRGSISDEDWARFERLSRQ